MNRALLLSSALALSAAAVPADAKVLNFASYPFNFLFSTSTALVPLGGTEDSPITTLTVTVPKSGRYVLTFSAECAAVAPSAGFVDIDLLLNGAALPPTAGSGNTFCMAHPNGFVGWERGSITVAAKLLAGANSIQVLGRLANGATNGWLGNTAIAVHN